MTWVLVLIIYSYNGAGMTSEKFSTKAECESIGKSAEKWRKNRMEFKCFEVKK